MKLERLTTLIHRSASRLVEAETRYQETEYSPWLWFLRRESTILVHRAIKLWIKLRFGKTK